MDDRLTTFMRSYAAAALLLKRAGERKSLIEYVVLAAALVDGALRMGLVLQHQLDTSSNECPQHLLWQGDTDKPISERAVYTEAFEREVIDIELHKALGRLYDKRNQVVHRYIISDITTRDVALIAIGYEQMIPRISEAVRRLELEQCDKGVGMCAPASDEAGKREDAASLSAFSQSKHGAKWLADYLDRESD